MPYKILLWQRIEPGFSSEMLREAQLRRQLIEEIHSRWGFHYEVFAEFDDEQVYRELFYARRSILSRRTGHSVRKELRSRGGNFFVNGTVAVLENGEPLYYAAPHRSEFLPSLLEGGADWLRTLVVQNEAKAARHFKADRLAAEFCERARQLGFHGQLKREYPLKLSHSATTTRLPTPPAANRELYADLSAKSIDILHQDGDRYDVIEVKPRLNWEAVGQALGYRELFCVIEGIHRDQVRAHVICRQTDEAVALACDGLGVNVILVSPD